QRREVKEFLETEIEQGRLRRVKKHLYARSEKKEEAALISGRLSTHRDGYGFVVPESGGVPDVFVPPHALANAVHGDKVRVRISRRRGKVEGEIVDVVRRSQQQVVGKLVRHGRQWLVAPLDERYHYTIEL